MKAKQTSQPKTPSQANEFQPDADELEHKPLPHASRWSLYLLAALAAGIIIWASIAKVDRIVVTQGKLVTTSPTIVVQPLETSIIRAIMVRVGQVVKKGQTLAALDPTFTEADVEGLKTRLSSFDSQINRLKAELSGKNFIPRPGNESDRLQSLLYAKRKESYEARMQEFNESLAKLRAELNTNRHDRKVLSQRLKGLVQIEKMRKDLYDKDFGSKLQWIEARNERLNVQRDLDNMKNNEPSIKHAIEQVRAQRKGYIGEHQREATHQLVTLRRERNAVLMELDKAEKRKDMVLLKAPSDAVVLQLAQRSVGSVVKQAETMITLVPLGSPLEAEIQIPSKDIGYVRKGDQVRLKFEAFPFQKHGTLQGRIISINEDAIEIQRGGGSAGTMYYLGRVSLEGTSLRAVPEDFRVMPGMTLTAEIKVGKRTIISYFLYPLIRVFDESLREP